MLLAGCAGSPAFDVPQGMDRIAFEEQPPPFCGRCETTSFIALSDGRVMVEQGYWAGDYRNWRTRQRIIETTPEQYGRFREALAPYKPARSAPPPDCATGLFDQDGAIVRWFEDGTEVYRYFDFGCLDDPESNDAVRRALQELVVGGPRFQ